MVAWTSSCAALASSSPTTSTGLRTPELTGTAAWRSTCPTSKAAALRYAKSLALTLAPDVRVNSVCPGAVWTGMQARISAEIQAFRGPGVAPDDEASFFARYEATTPLRRPQTPEDVAKAVAFLASSDARQITGQCLHVDGGAIIRD